MRTHLLLAGLLLLLGLGGGSAAYLLREPAFRIDCGIKGSDGPWPDEPPQKDLPHVPASEGLPTSAKVARVVDGDTLLLEGGERLRLLGVDTPETKHPQKPVERFGREASEFTRKHLADAKVRLVYDQANAARKHRDRYGRLLVYVHRERDDWDHCAELLRQGFANTYTAVPIGRLEEFRRLEREAREAKRGLWGAND